MLTFKRPLVLCLFLCAFQVQAYDFSGTSDPVLPKAANDNKKPADELKPENPAENQAQQEDGTAQNQVPVSGESDAVACQSLLQDSLRACGNGAVSVDAPEDVSQLSSSETIQATGKIISAFEKKARQKFFRCKNAIQACHRACASTQSSIASQCLAQADNMRRAGEGANQARRGKEQTDRMDEMVADKDRFEKIRERLEKGLPAYDNESSGGNAPGMNPITLNLQPESTQAQSESEDPKQKKSYNPFSSNGQDKDPREALLERAGLAGGLTPQPMQLGETQVLSAAELYRAAVAAGYKAEGQAPPSNKPAPAASASEAREQGKGGFVHPEERRRFQLLQQQQAAQAANAPVAARTPASNNASQGLPGQYYGEGNEWQTASMADGGLGRRPSSAPAANGNYGELNQRMQMETGQEGGSAQRARPNQPGLEQYLPTGKLYNARRNAAGADLPADGIQSPSKDIWGLISQRFRARCLSGRLVDCR